MLPSDYSVICNSAIKWVNGKFFYPSHKLDLDFWVALVEGRGEWGQNILQPNEYICYDPFWNCIIEAVLMRGHNKTFMRIKLSLTEFSNISGLGFLLSNQGILQLLMNSDFRA